MGMLQLEEHARTHRKVRALMVGITMDRSCSTPTRCFCAANATLTEQHKPF